MCGCVGRVGNHCPSSQGWAPECPLHHVGVFLHCGCGLVGSEFPSFLCDYLSSVHVVCYIHVHVFSCIYMCRGYEQCVCVSIVYMYVWYDVHVHVHVCMRVAHRTHVHVHNADTQHTCPCMCQHMMLLPNTHEYTMLLPKPRIHDPPCCSHRSECQVFSTTRTLTRT